MAEADLLFEFLVIALDAPAPLGLVDQVGERGVFGQRREPIFGRFGFILGPFDQEPFLRPRRRPRIVPMRRRSRTAAKREVSGAFVPSRQVTTRQASSASVCARSLAETGLWSGLRRTDDGGRPRPPHTLGGSGPVPGGHRLVEDWMPTTYLRPSALTPLRKPVSMP